MADTTKKSRKFWIFFGFLLGIVFAFMAARYLNSEYNKIDRTEAQQEIKDLTVANFASTNISQWTNDAGYLSTVDISQIKNGANLYFDYRPNNVQCANNQILRYDLFNARWVCGNDSASSGSSTWGSITGSLSAQSDLKAALDAKLSANSSLGGDVTGDLSNTTISNDSHEHTGSTISGLSVADFTSSNISQWTNDAGFLTGVNFSQIMNGTGIFLDYRPDNTACTQGQVLKYDAALSRWICGTDSGAGAVAWGDISGNIADQSDLNAALTTKLGTTASFGGDVTGTYDAIVVTNDGHEHTGATISGLAVADFSSQNISQWTNDSGYITNDTSVPKDNLTNTGTLPFTWSTAELASTVIVEGENISLLTNNAGYITGLNHSQVTNANGIYWDYRPNNAACSQDQVLKYDAGLNRWVCGNDTGASSVTWGAITGTLSDQNDLNIALQAKLATAASFGGDVAGTYNNLAVSNDSHDHTAATISGLGVADFTSPNISQWTNDSGFISGVNFAQVANGSNIYLNYKPNDTACSHDQTLKYDAGLSRWVCGNDNGAGTIAWGSINGTLGDQADLSAALSSKLNLTATFGGDASGTYDNLAISNDSHNHTGATITGLGTSNFTSANISQWINDSGYITGIDVSQVANGSGKYFNYKPNDTACSNGQTLEYDATNSRWICANDDTGTGGGGGTLGDYILLRDEKPSGTSGGTFTPDTWQKRVINTEVFDEGNHATLSSDQITLPAGTYTVRISAPAYYVNQHKIRLQNITDATTTLTGTSEYSGQGGNGIQTRSEIVGKFTISGTKVFEVQHYGEDSTGTQGLGVQLANGSPEIYTVVELWYANGTPSTVTVGSMTGSSLFADSTADDDWLGLGVTAARIEFDDQATDEVQILDANVGIGQTQPQHKLDVNGNIGIVAAGYLNFGTSDGSSGYGIRDNSGEIEYKDDGGTWIALNSIGSGGGGGSSPVVSVSTVQTRTQASFVAPNTGGGIEITPLNITMTPKRAGNKILLEWVVNGEVNENTVFTVWRNGTILTNSDDGGSSRWSGIASAPYDANDSSTPMNLVIKIVDENSLDVATTYSIKAKSSWLVTNNTFWLNRTIVSAGGENLENTLSTGVATEIDPTLNGGASSVTVGSMTGSTVFADATADDKWIGLGATSGRIEFDDQAVDELQILNASVGIGVTQPQHTLDVNGNIGIVASGYLNFGTTDGSTGYGIRDNNGKIEVKNNNGNWKEIDDQPSWSVNPDKPPASANAMDDEFNDTTVDAKWTQYTDAGGNASYSEYGNLLELKYNSSAANTSRYVALVQPAPVGNWKFRTKMHIEGILWTYTGGGLLVRNSSSNKNYWFAYLKHGSYGDGLTGYYGRFTGSTINSEVDFANLWTQTYYLEVEYDGTNLYYRTSTSGVSYQLVHTEVVASQLGSAPEYVGILLHPYSKNGGYTPQVSFDWFRRVQ